MGENVEYFSQRSDEWIDATVTRLHSDGAVTLDIKEYADPAKIRRVTSAAPAPARAPGSPQDFPRARSPPRRVRGEYRAGDRVEYHSVSSSASFFSHLVRRNELIVAVCGVAGTGNI